jgi:hypothetical protein
MAALALAIGGNPKVVADYLNGGACELLGEFVEVEARCTAQRKRKNLPRMASSLETWASRAVVCQDGPTRSRANRKGEWNRPRCRAHDCASEWWLGLYDAAAPCALDHHTPERVQTGPAFNRTGKPRQHLRAQSN